MAKFARVLFLCLLPPAWGGAADAAPPERGDPIALPYLNALHAKVHRQWADNFLAMARAQLPLDHPINTLSRAVDLAVVLSAEGKLVSAKVAKPSGASEFDSAAIDVLKASSPLASAPEAVLSDDGNVHLSWTFARDDRHCSILSVEKLTSPVDVAVPMLVKQGRESVAIARLRALDDQERPVAFAKLARAWLDRHEDDKEWAPRVAAANAVAGDARGAERLRGILAKSESAEWVALAARGLAALKISLCPLLKDQLPSATPETIDAILSVLPLHADEECVPWLLDQARDKARQIPTARRAAAIAALAGRPEPEVASAIKDWLKDKDPTIRAAAMLANARSGAGKGALFRLTPQLLDQSLDVRAAAATAIVRIGGESALPQLFSIFKEKDPRPYESVATELGLLSGDASAEMLIRFAHKNDRAIRLAGARALAARSDDAAGKALRRLASIDDPEVRFLASANLDPQARLDATSAPEGYKWTESAKALLRGPGKLAVTDWILAQFPKLDPATRIDLMGAWLAASPTSK